MPRELKKILVAPLDWGLGHATRCIPLIRFLMQEGHEVVLGVCPGTDAVLNHEFPTLKTIELPAYRIHYSAYSWGFGLKLLLQLPRLIQVIRAEHKALQQAVANEGITHVISDNRYGLWHSSITTSIICHQTHLQWPVMKWLEPMLNAWHYRFLNRFHACFIPDTPEHHYAGELSRPMNGLKRFTYIGPLSRFTPIHPTENMPDVLIVLSGPEPQRTLLETNLLNQFASSKLKGVLVRGTASAKPLVNTSKHLQLIDLAQSETLQHLMASAKVVVCRSGYSTLMDLAVLNKKALLIPTPGQTEQEYLANWWSEMGFGLAVEQSNLKLEENIARVMALPEPQGMPLHARYEKPLTQWLNAKSMV